jgi:hypothetical protein
MRASRELGDLVPMIAEHYPDSTEVRLGLASAIAEIGLKVLQPAFAADPELEREFDMRVRKLGRAT